MRPVLTAGVCTAAILLLAVPLLTLQADARGGGGGGGRGGGGFGGQGGGFGGHGGGFGGHGGFAGRGGGMGFAARGGGLGLGGARSFGVARFGGASVGARSFGVARVGGSSIGARSFAGRSFAGRSFTSPRGGVAPARLAGTGGRFATASARTLAGPGIRTVNSGRGVFGNRVIANVAWRSQFASSRFHGRFFGSRLWPWWRGGLVIGWFGPLFWPYADYDFFGYVFWPYAYDDFWPYAYDDVYYGIYGNYAYIPPGPSSGGHRVSSPGHRASRADATERRAAEVCSDDAAQLTDWPIQRISLSDEQKARFNATAPADDPDAAGKDQRDLTKFCDEKAPGVTDLPIDRIAQAVQPTPAQRAALAELKDASVKAAEGLKTSCPTYQTLTPAGRIEAMEKRLDATLGAVKTVQPALAKFYNSLSDEQKARFNSLRSASRPVG
jgi:hypothetical protein